MGRTLYDIARECKGYGEDFIIKGFIDDNIHSLDGLENYPPILAAITQYTPTDNDVFACSIGGKAKQKCIDLIIAKNGKFINLIHKTARIGTNVKIGEGNIIAAFVSIGSEASIGDHNMIQSYSVIGHDAKIGNRNRIDTHVVCVGGIVVQNDTNIHTSAVINHKVTVEDNATVAALSFAIRKVKQGTTVLGNPAKKIIN